MLQIKRSGNGFQVKVSEPGTGFRGYSLHAKDAESAKNAVEHYYGTGHGAGLIPSGNCPFCKAIEKDKNAATGPSCPSNDHSNGDRNYKPHAHKDGGYALKQEWL